MVARFLAAAVATALHMASSLQHSCCTTGCWRPTKGGRRLICCRMVVRTWLQRCSGKQGWKVMMGEMVKLKKKSVGEGEEGEGGKGRTMWQ